MVRLELNRVDGKRVGIVGSSRIGRIMVRVVHGAESHPPADGEPLVLPAVATVFVAVARPVLDQVVLNVQEVPHADIGLGDRLLGRGIKIGPPDIEPAPIVAGQNGRQLGVSSRLWWSNHSHCMRHPYIERPSFRPCGPWHSNRNPGARDWHETSSLDPCTSNCRCHPKNRVSRTRRPWRQSHRSSFVAFCPCWMVRRSPHKPRSTARPHYRAGCV